ncbi:2'-5' RNA ligase family protein [Quadrisphaera setariae]|uniref:2'-5' RNA ligase family protein n=2 Tax=Quadrisphaera setariae TaxID=2593304 RepID=A0A5C8ZIF2_9ACTN|nr:2'-5' RNA ligase family protein [Quadrisphaera setariae]
MWTWHVTFDGDRGADLHALAAAHAPLLDVPGLDVVPAPWLHLTVHGVAFTDEVDDDDVDRVVAAARTRLAALEAFDVQLGPAVLHGGGALLPAAPAEPFHALQRELRAAVADVLGPDRVEGDGAGFRPHVSLAYSNRAWDATALAERVRAVEPAVARVRVSEAQLIRLGRDEHLYRWDAAHPAPLGRSAR